MLKFKIQMRDVKIRAWIEGEKILGKTIKAGRYEDDFNTKAKFHQWGVAFEECGENAGNFTTAIVELEDGRVQSLPVSHIRFVKKNRTITSNNDKAYQDEFLERFNKARKHYGETIHKNFKDKEFLDKKSLTQLSSFNKKNIPVANLIKVTMKAFQDKYHIETEFKYITPEYVTREVNYTKYYNG